MGGQGFGAGNVVPKLQHPPKERSLVYEVLLPLKGPRSPKALNVSLWVRHQARGRPQDPRRLSDAVQGTATLAPNIIHPLPEGHRLLREVSAHDYDYDYYDYHYYYYDYDDYYCYCYCYSYCYDYYYYGYDCYYYYDCDYY